VQQIKSNMVVGLGTGSTATFAIQAIGRLLAEGKLHNIRGVPTSEASAEMAGARDIPLTTLTDTPVIDITIDGADEIDPNLDLIKGLGGALLREKVVAQASRRMIIVGDYTKRVERLGTQSPVPVEVIRFAQRPVTDYLTSLGARVVARPSESDRDELFVTDEGNIILDCHFDDGIDDPQILAQAIVQQPGVVEHGLFLGLASEAIVASPDGIEHLG
jgi:ribose 5-phosphate isomerase A